MPDLSTAHCSLLLQTGKRLGLIAAAPSTPCSTVTLLLQTGSPRKRSHTTVPARCCRHCYCSVLSGQRASLRQCPHPGTSQRHAGMFLAVGDWHSASGTVPYRESHSPHTLFQMTWPLKRPARTNSNASFPFPPHFHASTKRLLMSLLLNLHLLILSESQSLSPLLSLYKLGPYPDCCCC